MCSPECSSPLCILLATSRVALANDELVRWHDKRKHEKMFNVLVSEGRIGSCFCACSVASLPVVLPVARKLKVQRPTLLLNVSSVVELPRVRDV